jgi:hypothetical protein
MKKTIFVPILVFFSLNLFSQEPAPPEAKARLGFRAQPVFTWMSFDTKHFKNDGATVGGKFGLLIDAKLGKNYAFGTGLDFLMAGGKSTISDTVFRLSSTSAGYDTISLTSRTYKLQYLEIPLTLKLKTNQIGYFTYFVQLGGTIGVNISAKAEDVGSRYLNGKPYAEFTETSKLKMGLASGSEVKLIRAEVNLGVGAEWSIVSNLSLMVGISYHKGLTNVFNGKNQSLAERYTAPQPIGIVRNPISQKATANYFALDLALLF